MVTQKDIDDERRLAELETKVERLINDVGSLDYLVKGNGVEGLTSKARRHENWLNVLFKRTGGDVPKNDEAAAASAWWNRIPAELRFGVAVLVAFMLGAGILHVGEIVQFLQRFGGTP